MAQSHIPDKPQTITIKQTDYEYLKHLIEKLAADLPYNQTVKRALRTINDSTTTTGSSPSIKKLK